MDNKKQRGTLKSKITRLIAFVDGIIGVVPPPSKAELERRSEYLETTWLEFDNNHRLIIEAAQENQIDAEEQVFAEYEEKYFDIRRKLDQLLQQVDEDQDNQAAGNGPPAHAAAPNIKLPKLDLPKFSGNFMDWTSFHDLFNSMVHTQPISNSQKLHYLKTSVFGEAASLIQSIDVTDANYEEAWKLLKERYQNQRQLVQCHLNFLFSQQALKEESSTNLRKLLDNTMKCFRALHVLGQPTKEWDSIFVYIVTDRMDPDSRRQWELNSPGTEFPKLESLKEFIEQRCRALDASTPSKQKQIHRILPKPTTSSHASSLQSATCICCHQDHPLHYCQEFLAMDVKQRNSVVKRENACFNCLRTSHSIKNCTSQSTCRKCEQRHHTLLHNPTTRQFENSPSSDVRSRPARQQGVRTGQGERKSRLSNHTQHNELSPVLLQTAIVAVEDSTGNYHNFRVLIDGGSEASLITESCVKALGLKRRKTKAIVTGVGENNSTRAKGLVSLLMKSRFSDFQVTLDALVMCRVTGIVPGTCIDISGWNHIQHIDLADPTFNQPGHIDILIGADVNEDFMTGGKIVSTTRIPPAKSSQFGWIVTGKVASNKPSRILSNVTIADVDDQLRKFWEIEECTSSQLLSKEEEEAERHFASTHKRDNEGRYLTKLPFKSKSLGISKSYAYRRLLQTERRLLKDPSHRKQYEDFMLEYIQLGHMEPIPKTQQTEVINQTNYLPHHFVLKATSTTTKFRVVFDASCKTSNGLSLNDNLMTGPTIQDEMFDLILRFRLNQYAYSADIAKMYRQINIVADDCDYLRILWRQDFKEPVQEYRLLTVTYGTASAPFTATRTLKQLAIDEGDKYPLAKEVLQRDFYVDDLIGGNDDIDAALSTQRQLIDCLAEGGMQLRKWKSNDKRLEQSVPDDLRETQEAISLDVESTTRALGLQWNTRSDQFFFDVEQPLIGQKITKRSILSEIAKLHDPLGWLAPFVIRGKILMQSLWLLGVGWDQPLPSEQTETFIQFINEMKTLNRITLPRYVCHPGSTLQLHGFSDGSEQAYAAAVYLRSQLPSGETKVNILCSKSRVAPLKKLTTPKLELCGTTLLARLMEKVKVAIKKPLESVTAWTDSTIALGWITAEPNRFKTFVCNRVTEAQSLVSPSNWRHVPGKDNPADLPSRGISVDELADSKLWWNGPDWLSKDEQHWPSLHIQETNQELRKPKLQVHHITKQDDIIERYSSLTRLTRITAWIRRFLHNSNPRNQSKLSGSLTNKEISSSLKCLLKVVQMMSFPEILKSTTTCKLPSTLAALNPFIADDGLVRVGGRLRHSSLSFDQKHPVLLPKCSNLSKIIISYEHHRLLHAGPALMMSSLRQRYWIVGCRSLVRQYIRNCMSCTRYQVNPLCQMMGDLPKERVTPARPFLKCGVDFGGPFSIKTMKGRGGKVMKSYICLFVCLATKAIHIELATDLTSETFIAALRRMMGRRGRIADIFSDNGNNFVGANTELKTQMTQMLNQQTFTELANNSINWNFIHPRGPHFGGIWEAGIKSAKKHLKRVVGDTTLTYEEFNTILIQVESCLNSRPLIPLSSNPEDLLPLTPGHFLIGEPLTSIPDPDLSSIKMTRLSRWQLVQQINQSFWKRWQSDYLNTLQQRTKWNTFRKNLSIDDLVIIKEDNIPPSKWIIGRVIETFPGRDNCVRVASIKTNTGIVKRPISRLILLFDDETNC